MTIELSFSVFEIYFPTQEITNTPIVHWKVFASFKLAHVKTRSFYNQHFFHFCRPEKCNHQWNLNENRFILTTKVSKRNLLSWMFFNCLIKINDFSHRACVWAIPSKLKSHNEIRPFWSRLNFYAILILWDTFLAFVTFVTFDVLQFKKVKNILWNWSD